MSRKHFKFVLEKLDKRTILEQLAEEGSELSKASLKTIRAEELSNNFTPVTREEAFSNLCEEIHDTLMVILLLWSKCKYPHEYAGLWAEKFNPKWERWAKRLGYKEEE